MSIRILGAPDSTWLRQATPLLACPIKLINSLEPVHAVVYVPETERKTIVDPPNTDNVRVCSEQFTEECFVVDMQAAMGFKKTKQKPDERCCANSIFFH